MRLIAVWEHAASGRIVLFRPNVLELLRVYRQADRAPEAGGILLGYRRDPHFEVTEITEPGTTDIRKRIFFDRCDPSHQKTAVRVWRESEKFIDYIGDWHSHPEPLPTPSGYDLNQWRKLRKKTNFDPMIQIIVGTDAMWVGLVVRGETTDLVPCDTRENAK